MSKIPFLPYHAFTTCSTAFQKAAAYPRHMGVLRSSEGMKLAEGTAHTDSEMIQISILVDEEDGIIADAKFQAFASPGFVAIAEIVCVHLVRKTYEQARRSTSDFILKLIESTGCDLPSDFYRYVNLVLDAVLAAATQCMDIPVAEEILTSPVDVTSYEQGELPDYENLTHSERLSLIQTVLDKDIRPYIELDAGGIHIVELKNEIELVISYQGACVTCPSSIGSTLDAITNILRNKIHPSMIVTPDFTADTQLS